MSVTEVIERLAALTAPPPGYVAIMTRDGTDDLDVPGRLPAADLPGAITRPQEGL